MSRNTHAAALGFNYRRLSSLPFVLVIGAALIAAGCSKGAGGNSLHVKSAAVGERDVPIKSSYAFAVTKSFTDVTGKMSTASSYRVYAASYDLDAGNCHPSRRRPRAWTSC